MNIYYVYAYLREKDLTPYYIGKGKGRRAYAVHRGISVPKDKTKIIFYHKSLTEIDALSLEISYIKLFGRKDLGTGILLNKTIGGDSGPGLPKGQIFSNEHKEKLSSAKKGKSWEDILGEEEAAKRRQRASLPRGPMDKSLREKISTIKKASNWKPLWTEESRFKLSQTNKGRIVTYEQKSKLKEASRITKVCPHCGLEGNGPSMQRWHFNHCRKNAKT